MVEMVPASMWSIGSAHKVCSRVVAGSHGTRSEGTVRLGAPSVATASNDALTALSSSSNVSDPSTTSA